MTKNKTIYIFPGWQETTRRNNYKKLKTFLEKKKYKLERKS